MMGTRASGGADDFRMAVIGALLGAAFFLCVFDYHILNPTYVDWLFANGDAIIHFTGFHFFRFEDWQFPLGKIRGYGIPGGYSVVFTDSIPLVAIVVKAFNGLLPQKFQYFGLWVLVSYSLQGFFGWRLASLITRSSYVCALITSFLILSPSMLFRADGHRALTAHWLLLAALYLCLQRTEALVSREAPFPRLRAWTGVILLSVGIHLYFCAMVLVLYGVKCLAYVLTHRYRVVRTSLLMSIPIMLMVLLLYAEGGFVVKSSSWAATGQTFGHFSMNLSAPVNPALAVVLAKPSLFVDPGPVATGGQYEGFNYLGLGFILLGLTTVVLGVVKVGIALKTTGRLGDCARIPKGLLYPTVISAVLLTAFAASYRVTWGVTTIYTVPLPQAVLALCEIFRSSGRFFWPAAYLCMWLVFWSCHSLLRHKPVLLVGLLHVALATQLLDLSPLIQHYAQASRVAHSPYRSPLQSPLWSRLMTKYERIYYYPTDDATYYLPFGLIAAPHQVGMNVVSTSRSDSALEAKARARLLRELQTGQLQPKSLYIFRDVGFFNALQIRLGNRPGSLIRALDGLYIAAL